ncbi:hypothetical protein ACPC54_27725 [Kitasatospora sp. NPDC094028]
MDQLHTLTWQYVAGLVPSEDLPMAAARLLAAGLDSPALRDLAGRPRHDPIHELFLTALAELGAALPDEATAERHLLHHLAARVTAGELTPRGLAAEVWRGTGLTAARTDAERALLDAVGAEYHLAHLAEARPQDVPAWAAKVQAAARRLAHDASASAAAG